ncbi:PfkB family carbohydrate kinase [Nocardia veterana]|uniref:HTH luxR-type domain-containing protein n=1 Tax=Nocardia veterana TaxID=132249 RepID=A0A7X6RLE6_9NOCA|nr:PfkB family carbohydrate kinase [Nocardia veterana]NKY89644.1 hypothetical protein [Nocardia veterana]
MGESVSSNPLVQLRELFDSLPSGLRQLVEMAVFAGELPRQDVSRMRSMAADLRAGAASLDFHAADLARISAQLDSVGAFGDGVREALRTHRQGAGTLRDDALFMADQVDAAANDAEKTLCVMYAFGIALVWRIARTLAAAAVAGPGGQLAAAPAVESTLAEGRAEFIGMRAALKQAYERIATALKQAYRQVGTETAIRRAAVWAPRLAVGLGKAAALPVAVDAGVQGWQVLRGYRDPVAIGPNGENPRGIDTESLWAAGASGVGGALGGMFAGRLIPKLTAQFAPTIGNRLQRSLVLQGLVNGGVGAGTGLLAATVVTGWPQNFGQVLAPLLNGGFAGAVHAHPAAHSGPGARVDGGGPFTRPDRVGTGHALDRNNSAVRESATAPVQKSPEAKRVQDNAKAEWRETPGAAAAESERIPTPTPGSKTESTAPQGSRSDDSPPTAHREASRRDPAERGQSAQASPRPEKPAPVEALPRNQPAPSTHTVTPRPIEAGRETAPPPRISASGPAGRELETIAAPGDHRTAGNEAHGWPGKQRNLTVESHRETSAGAHPAVASGGTHTSVGTADHGSLNGEQGRTGKPVGADSTAVSTAGRLSAGTVEQVSPNEDAAAAHGSASEQPVTEAGTRPAEGDDPSTADRDSDERIDEPQAQSNANIAAADEYRASVLAETGTRLESARDHLTKTREQWEKSRTAFHGEVANHEARVRGELGKSIEAVQGRVTAARKAWQDSRNEYDKESHSSEPREEHLERLRSDIDERISRLREEMVERAALLRAAPGDHRAELEAARSEYGGFEREAREFRESEFRAGRPSLTDRITRWFGREHTGAAEDAAFESAVSKRERELREWLDARESEAQAQLLGELKEKLDACTAEYTEAQEEFRPVGLDVLNDRLAVLNEVGRADMDALDAGLLDRDRAFAAVSTKQKEALSAFLEAANAYDAEAWRSDEVVQRIPDSKVLDSLNDGTPAERFAAAREYIRRADSEGRDLRDTQLQAIASRWSNLRTGEGKGLVTVVKAWLTARESGRVYVTTSGDNQVKDLIDEFGKFQRSEIGGPRVQVDRMSTEGGLPVPEEGVGHIVVGTMRDLKEAVLHEESRMLNRLGDAGATPEEVAALRGWFNEERPNIDEMAKIFDEAAARHNLDDRFDPFPDGKHIADEFDTLADGEESVLVPGGNEEAPPEEVELLQRVTDRFRAATALPADPLTAADFGKPEHTRGFWRVQVDAAVIEKLNRVEGPPITASDHALIERYGQRALAEWGPRRNSDWIKGHGDTAEEPYKTKTLASETTDKVMADSKKKSETRYQGVQQFLDLDAGVPVKANLPEGALHVSDAQLIGTRRLQDTEGHSGTGKVVEKELFERGIIKGPVTEIDPYYKSQVKHLQDLNFDTAHDKLQHLARSILRDAKIELVDRKGNVLAGEDGTVLIDDDGHVLDRNGHLVDHDGNVIDRDGTILVDRDGNVLVDKDGRMVDKAGNVLVDEDGTALVDRNGHLVDGDGNLVDRAGHVLVDRDGNVLVDRAGRVVGTDGRPVETDGCVAGVRMAGRDQVVGSFDNRNLRGDDIRIDKDGNQIELSGWTDKEGHDHTKGVVDWVDQLTDQQVRAIVACDARLTISEEFESAGVKLKYDVLDARFDDDHGCGDEAERVGKAIVDDFGNRNRHEAKLVFVNKSRMRGTDYKTIERAIAQGGLSGKFVGGAGYGERAVIQGDGRIGRGGKGPREAGGTPGTVQHWYSPEDYWAPVADHGVVRQVIHFQEAVETHRHAATAYREEPTPERRAALREANHDLKQAIRDLRRDASPTMQRVVDERLLSGARTRTHQANAPPTTSPNERNDELGRQEPLSRSGGHPPLGLVDRARLPLPPAAALRQRLDASAPGAAEYYALGDEQALGELTSRRDRLAEAVGWKPAEIEGAEGLRLVGAATTIAQHELAQALGVADSDVTVAKAQEVLGKAAARQPAGYDMHLTTGTNAGITDRAHAGPSVAGELPVDTAVADNQVAENPVPEDTVVKNTAEKTVADKTVAAASRYLANAALLDLVIHIFRHSRNRCVNNGVTAMRVLCPKNADRFTMPPGEIPLRGHNWATIKSSFRNGSHNLSRSLEQAVEPLKRRPGGIQVLVYKWKNSAEQDSDLADSHLVLLVNDSERDDEPNLVVVDLEASRDSTPDRAVGPGDLTDARALLDKAVEFGLWQREQQKFINNLSERGFWTIDFDRHGDLAPDSADQDTTRQKTHVPPQLVREIDDAGESVQADEPRVLAGVGSRPMDDGDAVAERARHSDPVAEYFGSPAVRRYDNDYGLEREVGEDGRPLPPEGIFASVDKHGILRMQVRASARTPRGFAMVAQMEAEIGHLVTGIQDYWTDAYDGLTTNIDRFNALLREHPDMTPEEAAGRTFTGRMAARRGFTDIRCDHLDGVRGYHHNVIVTFTRPEASRHGDRPTRTSSEPAGTQPHRTNEPEAPAPGSVAAVIAGEGPGMPAAAKAHEIVTAFGEEKQKQVPLFGSMFERLLGKDSLQSVKAVRKLIDDPEIVRWLDLLVARRDPDVSETMPDRGAARDSPADGSSRPGAFDLVRDDGGERPVPDSSKLPLIGDLLDISPDETDDLVLTAVLKGLEGKYGPYYLFGLEAWYVKDARGIRWIEMNARIAGPGGRDIGSVARQFYRDEQGRLVALHEWLKLSEKAYRRRGFGKAFTEAMESYYRRSGVDRVRVHVLGEDGGLVWALAGFGWDPECLPDTLEMITARIAQLQSRVSEKDAELLGRYLRSFEGAPRPVETYPTPYELATMKGEDPDLGAKLMRGSSWWGVKFLSSSTPAEWASKTGGEQTDGQSTGARPRNDAETTHPTTEPGQANAATPPEAAAPKHEPSPTPWSTGSAVGDDPPSMTAPAEDAGAARPAETHSGRPEPTRTAMPFDEPGTRDETAGPGSATVQENIPARPDVLPDNGIGVGPSDDHARAALTDLHELLGDSSLGATAAAVFSLVRLGMTHSEIATTLDLSERDVRAHLAGIRRKLGNRRARLVAAPRAAEPHMTPEFGLFRAAMYKALIGAEPPDPRQLIAEASPARLEHLVQHYDSSSRAAQNPVRGGARSRVAATMALLAARRVVSALADDHYRLQASLATALAEATPTELRTALDELSAADRQLLNQRFGPTPSPATFDPEGSVRDIRAVDIIRQVATRISSGATVPADSENSSATSIFQREQLGAEHDLPAAVQQVNSAATQTYSTNECLDAITEWVDRKDAAQANMVPAHEWRSLPVDHGFDDEQQRLADGALRAGGLDSADKLRRREQRPSMQDAQHHSNEIGRWWDSLSDPAEPGGLSKAQRALIQVYPQQIGNADGLPAVIRDHANRLAIRRELDEFVARKPVGVGMLAWLRTELTAAERKQFSNLVHVRNHLRQMDMQATEVPGSPPVHLLSYDSTAFHGNGKVVAALGNVDTAHTVNWHVPGTNTASTSLAYQFKPLRNLYEETLRVEPSLELASIIWIGYAAPTGPLNTGYAKAAFRRRARVGGIRLRCDIAAFHATRRRTGTADRSQLVNRLYGFSYGSTTTCYAGRDGRLAGLVHSVILAGSPGTGPLRHAAEFGIGADNVYIFGSWRDTVSTLGAGETGVQRLFYPVVGLGMDPARKTFGAVRLPAEFSDSLVSTGMVHRGYLDRDPATGQANESLTSAAHITAGRGATLARAGHRRAGRWVVARPIDPERGRYANGNNDSAVGRFAVRTGDTEADEGGGRPRGSVGSGPEESAAEPSAPGSGSNFPSGGTTPPAEVLRPTPWSELGGQGDRAGAVASEPEVLIGRTEEPVAGSSARGSDVPLLPASGTDEPGAARPADVDDAEAPGGVPATHSPEGEGVEPTRSSTPWSSRETDAGSASEGSGVRPAASAGAHRAVPRRPEPSGAHDAEDAHSQRTVAAARLRAVAARLGIASSEPGAAALEALRARAGRARESLAGLLGIAPSDLAVPQHLQQPVERLQDHLRSLDDAGWSQLARVDPAALRSWLVEASRLQSDTQIATARAIEGDRTLADAVPGRRSAEAARLVDPTGVRESTAQQAGGDPLAELKRLTTVAGAEAARLAAAIVEYLETSSAVDTMTELLNRDTDPRSYLEANGLLEPSRSAAGDIEAGGITASDDTERKPGDGAEAPPGAESDSAPPGHEADPDNDRPENHRADTTGLLGSPRVVVFGPAVIDVVVEHDELPAAGEYRRVRSFREVVGGKALNQAVAAARLGARVAMVSAIGSDGHEIRQTLRREGIGDAGVRIENDVTSEKVACLVGPDGEPSFVFHAPPELDLTGDDVGSNIAAIENADFVLLTPRLPYSVVARTASVARRLGVTVVLQPPLPREPSALDAVRMADVLVPNETEARALLSAASIDADTTPGEELPERLFELLGVPTIIVTLGAAGCVVHHQGRTELFRAHPTRVVDTTGASDAFTAALAMGLNAGLPVDHAVRIGLSAAAHTVAQIGGSESMPYVHQVDLALPGGPPDDTLFHQ